MKMTAIERFWQFVHKTDTCWLWTGATCGPKQNPYGQFWNGKKNVRAHRFSYETFVGSLNGLDACHHCDAPLCVRPIHLFPGTMSDNIKDAIRKGRMIPPGTRGLPPWNKGKASCVHGHEYTDATTRIDKHGWRHCRTCKQIARKDGGR